ncbi:DUF934 domain-containing protein [Bosea lathyri]|uniref:Uncharacterized conserved protein, DUF934 family n=1 Tax=Bosea lathyri TaxID=1036778 RepID=A0A1H5VP07_9HYPH|nr:DUF934 domain-containing protein [Bosea lathyri]SEF88950.1 Uncharacterized conserved protein, DUF934 family [Bosea lathyri]
MPLLDRNGAKDDIWARSEGAAIGNISAPIVPWDALPDALNQRAPDQPLGVLIPNNISVEALKEVLPHLALVAISFPAYSDGRGFSLARQLRRHGFTGTLRASGPLIADQFAYALSSGFDEVELPEASAGRQPVAQWLRALEQISHTYQRGYGDGGSNILDQRRAARAAAQVHSQAPAQVPAQVPAQLQAEAS